MGDRYLSIVEEVIIMVKYQGIGTDEKEALTSLESTAKEAGAKGKPKNVAYTCRLEVDETTYEGETAAKYNMALTLAFAEAPISKSAYDPKEHKLEVTVRGEYQPPKPAKNVGQEARPSGAASESLRGYNLTDLL